MAKKRSIKQEPITVAAGKQWWEATFGELLGRLLWGRMASEMRCGEREQHPAVRGMEEHGGGEVPIGKFVWIWRGGSSQQSTGWLDKVGTARHARQGGPRQGA